MAEELVSGSEWASSPSAFEVAAHFQEAVGKFYRDVLWALGEHARTGGTAQGAAAVVRRVAREYGVREADSTPLPRLTRAEREDLAWRQRGEGRHDALGRGRT
jgi:hypothetical protein